MSRGANKDALARYSELQLVAMSIDEVLTCQLLPTIAKDVLVVAGDHYNAQHCSLQQNEESLTHYV